MSDWELTTDKPKAAQPIGQSYEANGWANAEAAMREQQYAYQKASKDMDKAPSKKVLVFLWFAVIYCGIGLIFQTYQLLS